MGDAPGRGLREGPADEERDRARILAEWDGEKGWSLRRPLSTLSLSPSREALSPSSS